MDEQKSGHKSETVLREEEVLAFWKNNNVFEKSLEKPAPKGDFIFYDGPPFATGLPHTGSLLSSVIKDVVPRYKTMRGFRVPRRWGWDCHGLPIESLVEKKLGLKTKRDILEVGVATFNETARSMVLRYVSDWEKYIDRIGRWVDFKNSYKTMDNSYIESVWWALKELNKKNLLYEGRKVLMYCTHCETPLAKAEIAMDNTYKDVTEEAVTVKFKLKNPQKYNLPENTYLLAWTTTPWTLPGNVALAVGPEIEYVRTEQNGEWLLLAEKQLGIIQKGIVINQDVRKGKSLIGAEYEPLFEVPALQSKRSYKVYGADFVQIDEGTGIVHTAVMYGEDDFALGQKEKLPQVQLLTPDGHYNEQAPEFIRGKYIKQAEKDIKADLEERGLLFAREMHTHSYPHCYRCGTALIYNAVASWFINIQKVKKRMLSENEKITWVPAHLRDGRFKNIVENAPDWTISRNRFWASPLPIWKEQDGKKLMVVGSLDELLSKTKKSGNRYFVMRHGEAHSNVTGIDDLDNDPENHLTELGKNAVRHAALDLKKEQVDMIIVSPFVRTRESAALIRQELGLPEAAVMVDERLHEANSSAPLEVRQRVGEFLFEVERRYTNKNILIVAHGYPLWALMRVAERKTSEGYRLADLPKLADVRELPFVPFPHNHNYELDVHRPYIDAIILTDSAGKKYERIAEVIDCWVESGSMPFASEHYPWDKKNIDPRRLGGLWPKGYPGDFIAEYIAQTRTWFYYMHAMGVLLFKGRAFNTVVSTGNILAKDGSKMSKSKGNYTDPYELMDKWGADALRFALMSSVVMQGEDLNFRDEDVREAHNRVIGILWNAFKFYELYAPQESPEKKSSGRPSTGTSARLFSPEIPATHILDRWVLSLLSKAMFEITEAMESYDTPRAARVIKLFVEDYSTWYVRRSRYRARGSNEDAQHTLATQKHVLITLSKLIAPLAPFIAESIYRQVGGDKESVHLASWPTAGAVDEKLLANMKVVRELASQGLELREKANIKVRQPLASFTITVELPPELAEILKDELNVKEIKTGGEVALDTHLTAELKEEGKLRDVVRAVQGFRKEKGLMIEDRKTILAQINSVSEEFIAKNKKVIAEQTGLKSFDFVAVKIDDPHTIIIAMELKD